MSYYEQLHAEIAAKVDALAAAGQPLNPSWITHEICNDHKTGLVGNAHSDFWRHGGYRTARQETGAYITKKYGGGKVVSTGHKQLTLPGYDHVQTHYIVERKGDEIGVPTHDLTDDEIDARVAVFRAYGVAYFAHADELERFKAHRKSVAVAATP